MVRRSRSASILVPVWANTSSPVRVLSDNPLRELYSIQNLDAANSVFIAPQQNVTAAAGSYQGQEVVARGYVSDDMDQGEVWVTTAAVAGVRITVQETITEQATRPGVIEPPGGRAPYGTTGRTPYKRESRVM